MVQPKYPKDALRAGTDVTVTLRAVVTPEGKTAQLIAPSESNEFVRAAIDAVRRWRFHPVILRNQPVETTYKVHVHFNSFLQSAATSVEVESPQPERSSPSEIQSEEAQGGPIYKSSDPGVVSPQAVYSPSPEFSEAARKSGESGTVILSLIVDTSGSPQDIRILCSSIPDMNEVSIETLKLWKFTPGTKDGEAVPVRIHVETTFHSY